MKNKALTDKELNKVAGGFNPQINGVAEQIREGGGDCPEIVIFIPEDKA